MQPLTASETHQAALDARRILTTPQIAAACTESTRRLAFDVLRTQRGLSRTRPFETKAPSDAGQKPASGGLFLIVVVALAGLALGGAAALTVSAMKTSELAAAARSFVAPTSLERQNRSIEQLIEGAAP